MEILVFLVVCHLVLVFWVFGFFSRSASKQKQRLKSRQLRQPLPQNLGSQERDTTISKHISFGTEDRSKRISVNDCQKLPRQLQSFKRTHNRFCKYQSNIKRGKLVIWQLRSSATEIELPMVIAVLRKMNPYAFEELLLTCCQEQGWQIQPNFRYSKDGGVDGRVTIAGKLYVIQAKRYSSYIKPKHIREFYEVIREQGSAGGLFIHTGKTGALSKQLLHESRITLISGQRLVDFVLGRRLKIVGITICV